MKIILHNMTLKGIENVPGVLNFDERGVILSSDGDVVVTRKPIDPFFLDYLKDLGYIFDNTIFLNSDSNNQTYDSIFRDQNVISIIKNHEAKVIESYQLTKYEEDFAKTTSKTLYGNVDLAEKYGTKSGFRKLCSELKIPIVQGFEHLTDIEQIKEKLSSFNSAKYLMRLDEGVSGAGNFIINSYEYNEMSEAERNTLLTAYLNRLPQRMNGSGATIEEWIDNVTSSPSLQFEVTFDKEIKLLSTHDQILEGEEKWYIGCKYPSTTLGKFEDKIISDGFKFVNYLKDLGFIGFCGLDVILTENAYYFVEANIRTPGTTYPREFVKKVFGSLDNLHYIARDFQLKSLLNKDFKTVHNKLRDILVTKEREDGVLIYNTSGIKEGGRVDVVVVSSDEKKLMPLLTKVEQLLLQV